MRRTRERSNDILPPRADLRQRRAARSPRRDPARAAIAGRVAALLLVLVCGWGPTAARGQTDFKQAPSAEELDARTKSWIQGRRVMAIVIVGGTIVAGAAGSVLRRRQRRAERDAAAREGGGT